MQRRLKASVLLSSGFVDHAADHAVKLLDQLASGKAFELAIIPEDEQIQYPRMHVDWQAEGYVVMCFEDDGSVGFYPVTNTPLSEPAVAIELGGQALEKWPPELFVPRAIASEAVATFVSRGQQDRSLEWVANDAFARKVLWATRAQRIAWERAHAKET
jgi:hypothetical protein